MNASTTTAKAPVRPSFDEIICNQVAAQIPNTVYKYISSVALPLHILVVSLLFLRVFKRRFYHYLIMAQCVTDIIQVTFLVVTHSLCIVFKKLVTNYTFGLAPPIQWVLTVYLMAYWKMTIRPQRLLDIFLCGISAISTLGIVADRLYRLYNDQNQPSELVLIFIGANISANAVLSAACFIIFLMVMRMDVSYFSEVTIKGQKKMTTALFLQLICMLVTNIFDIFGSYMNYRSTMDPFVFELNIKATNVTDPVLIQQYQQELLDYLGPIEAVLTTIDLISTVWLTYLPFIRAVLIIWAIRPLLQKTKVIMISHSTTEAISGHPKSFL